MAKETEIKTISKELEVKLTPVEMAEMLRRAGELQLDIEEKKKAFATVRGEHQKVVKEAQAEIHQLLAAGNEGRMMKLVDVECIREFNGASVSYRYNGDIVETRAMTEDELQGDFFQTEGTEDEAAEDGDDEGSELSIDEQIAQDVKESTSKRTASTAVS